MLHVHGQQKIDSLLQQLKISSGRQAIDINIQLCYEYGDIGDESNKFRHAKLAFSMAKELNDSLGIIKAGRIVGRGYKIFDQIDSVIYIFKYTLPIAKGSRFAFEYDQLLNTLAVIYIASSAEALRCSFESLSVMETLDNNSGCQRKMANQLLDQKVVERTKELELGHQKLRRRLEEEDVTTKKQWLI